MSREHSQRAYVVSAPPAPATDIPPPPSSPSKLQELCVPAPLTAQNLTSCVLLSLATEHTGANPVRHVELDIDIGADAQDWAQIQAAEKLKPVETELRRMEQMVAEIVVEMEYLRTREQKLRDTNESTNERVKWFAFGTMGVLVGLGAWQIIYLRAYFRYGGNCRPFRSGSSLPLSIFRSIENND